MKAEGIEIKMNKYHFMIIMLSFLLFTTPTPVYAQENTENLDTEDSTYNPFTNLPKDCQPQEPIDIILTQDWVITENLGIITVSNQLTYTPGQMEELTGYPGYTQPITIDTNGYRIIVKDGGVLNLQELDINSMTLCIRGEHTESIFYVENGGTLILNQVLVETQGTAVKIEAEANYSWYCSEEKNYPEPSKEAKTGLKVVELALGVSIQPLKIFDDTFWEDELATNHLQELSVVCSVDGMCEVLPRKLHVIWDTESQRQALEAREDCILEGTFVDENSFSIESHFVPMLPVYFLQRRPVNIISADLKLSGMGTYIGEIHFEIPVDYEKVFLEVSEDSGQSWYQISAMEEGIVFREEGIAYFEIADNQTKLYRIMVEGGPNAGNSKNIQLPESIDSEPNTDSEDEKDKNDSNDKNEVDGNRGGGTVVNPPDRELPMSQTQESEKGQVPKTNIEDTEKVSESDSAENQLEQMEETGLILKEENKQSSVTKILEEEKQLSQSKTLEEGEKQLSQSKTLKEERNQFSKPESLEDEIKQSSKEESSEKFQPSLSEEEIKEPFTLSNTGQAAAAILGAIGCGTLTGIVCSPTLRKWFLKLLRKLLGR